MNVQTGALTACVSASEESCSEHNQEIALPRVAEIQDAVCRRYGISMVDMLSRRRERRVARPRQVGMYLARHLTTRTYPEIGKLFGRRDHSTVIHGVVTIEEILKRDAEMTADVTLLRLAIALTVKARIRREMQL